MAGVEDEGAEESVPVNGQWDRGQEIKRRRLAMGIKGLREFARVTGQARAAITAAEDGHGSKATYERLEAWLDRMEEEMGDDVPADPPVPAIEQIEIVFEGRGVKLTMKAPISDPDAAEAMAARLMRLIRDEG